MSFMASKVISMIFKTTCFNQHKLKPCTQKKTEQNRDTRPILTTVVVGIITLLFLEDTGTQ
jgi:hypothetical protein